MNGSPFDQSSMLRSATLSTLGPELGSILETEVDDMSLDALFKTGPNSSFIFVKRNVEWSSVIGIDNRISW